MRLATVLGVAFAASVSAADPRPVGGDPTPAEVVLNSAAVGQQNQFGAQLQFGYPTGLRVQYAVHKLPTATFLAEAFAGAEGGFWGDEAVYGAGGRALFTLASDGDNDALVFAPGLGLSYWRAKPWTPYYAPYTWGAFAPQVERPDTDRWFINLDAQIGWLHDLSPGFGWELGLSFGARIGLSGREDGKPVSGKVRGGTIGIYTGVRF